MPYYINLSPDNPLSRLLAAGVGVLVLVGAVFFGLIVLAFVLGAGLLLSLGLWIRARFARQRGGSRAETPGPGRVRGNDGEIIEAEYTVISKRRD